MPSEHEQRGAVAPRSVAALGATMAAANYRVTMVRAVMEQTSRAYGLDRHFLALPNFVRVGSPTGEGRYIANPDSDVRYGQSFALAQLVTRAPTGSIGPEEGLAELDRIRNQRRRFPVWVTIVGYAVQSAWRAAILQPTPWSLIGAASMGFMVGALSALGRVTQLLGTHSTAVFTATLISMMSIAVGVQGGLLLWRAAIQLASSPNRRVTHD